MTAHIDVVSQTEGTFKVGCTSRGGGVLNMSVTGSGGFNTSLKEIRQANFTRKKGNGSYIGTTDVILKKSNGELYNCTASNRVSIVMDSIELKGLSQPYVHTLYYVTEFAQHFFYFQLLLPLHYYH